VISSSVRLRQIERNNYRWLPSICRIFFNMTVLCCRLITVSVIEICQELKIECLESLTVVYLLP